MNFYDKLAATPLFQGLTSSDLIQIIGQTKFSFYKFASDKTIRNEGEPCRSMAFLLSGTARMVTYADDHGFPVEETVTAPCILQPERLFGLTQRYTRNFIAASSCAIMEIDKNDILRLTDELSSFASICSTSYPLSHRKPTALYGSTHPTTTRDAC